ncbi:phosphoenolpyruvate--protein phosphotransferase [Bengtsoniella intestinalis]|uniref:phosphoenolpyruvate--protein phosphotransferase n=1 Tax=Bengtsoniella intestinalis TaxID=3073143 RepID=UPI00391F5D49
MEHITVEKAPSRGIVMGKAYLLKKQTVTLDTTTIAPEQADGEVGLFQAAVAAVVADLQLLAEHNPIFGAHIEVAEDVVLLDAVETKIRMENKRAALSLQEAVDEIVDMFAQLDDEYLRERAADIQDVGRRILLKVLGVEEATLAQVNQPSVVIAEDLAPSDTAAMNAYVKGFVTKFGGATSHVVIMARSMEMPAAVGVGDSVDSICHGDAIILDCIDNVILVNPDADTVAEYEAKITAYQEEKARLAALSNLPATTVDGKTVEIFANVGNQQDVEFAVQKGAEGIGLFRTEFLYMQNTKFPTEEEQFEVYKTAIQTMKRPTILRTLDIGGDKELSYYEFDKEENPFLGWRAIRICLDMKDVFKTQLRAMLRASAYGDIRIMFPMIISLEELRAAREVLEECKEELRASSTPFNDSIQTGIMIETPAAVLMARELASEADFFSIGTNDLTQYLLAVDRGNQKIAKLYNSFHPAVLRAIAEIIAAGHAGGIEVGMCGEFASDPRAIPVLLGLGLDEFSMSASEVAASKYAIRGLDAIKCETFAKEVCAQATLEQVLAMVSQ